jgi:peptidoglycan/LPS O-acetylase OafA/YrhL
VTLVAEARTARYEFLDALRGIAILLVVLLHFAERGVESEDSIVHDKVWPVLQHGYLGVQLFFVISGYCIMAAVASAAQKANSVQLFAARRLRRIFPPYWASILFVVFAGLATRILLNTPWETIFPLAAWEWIANIFLVQEVSGARDPGNFVYWSLSIELQFYVILAICLLMSRKSAETWLVLISLLSAILATTHAVPLTGWVLNYWSEFACGIAAYFWITRTATRSATPWLLVAFAFLEMLWSFYEQPVLTLPSGRFIPAIRIAFCLLVMLLMIVLYQKDSDLCRIRMVRALMATGTISYSLYLTHVPVGTRIFNLGQRITGLDGLLWLPYFGLSLLASGLIGLIFFRLCERPWMNSPLQQKMASPPESVLVT